MNEQLEKVAAALHRRGFETAVFDTGAQAVQHLLGLLPEKQEIGMGGSATLAQLGVRDALCAAGHTVFWHQGASAEEAPRIRRAAMKQEIGMGGSATLAQLGVRDALCAAGHTVFWHQGASAEEAPRIRRAAMNAPVYLASANAVTEDGLIVQIDGTGNRVAAMCFGPSLVCLIVGRNKLVKGGYPQAVSRIKQIACPQNAQRLNLNTAAMCFGPSLVCLIVGRNKLVKGGYPQAVSRIKQIACPQNAQRLNLNTPCRTGRCNVSACTSSMCRLFLTMEQPPRDRRTVVLLVDEALGY